MWDRRVDEAGGIDCPPAPIEVTEGSPGGTYLHGSRSPQGVSHFDWADGVTLPAVHAGDAPLRITGTISCGVLQHGDQPGGAADPRSTPARPGCVGDLAVRGVHDFSIGPRPRATVGLAWPRGGVLMLGAGHPRSAGRSPLAR